MDSHYSPPLELGLGLGEIEGTCIRARELPKDFTLLPSHEEVSESKEKFWNYICPECGTISKMKDYIGFTIVGGHDVLI